jgi:adenine deaminase
MIKKLSGNIVDLFDKVIFHGEISYIGNHIFDIRKLGEHNPELSYFLPGFVDAHVHIESSMLTPSQFALMAFKHGTVATVSDPHEIANVLGMAGINYMVKDGKKVPFYFNFGAPSCVPATIFETAGAEINLKDLEELFQEKDIKFLAEVMNYPGVISEDPGMIKKIELAQKYQKLIDGHAPGIMGADAEKYFSYGISTDHECYKIEEALEKLKLGVKILIREGSAAKNFDELIPLAKEYADQMMFCSDDIHPDDLVMGHINLLVKRAVQAGVDIFDALRMACIHPVVHYGLENGLMREGDSADFIEVDNLQDLNVKNVWIKGKQILNEGEILVKAANADFINHFKAENLYLEDIKIEKPERASQLRLIEIIDGQLITENIQMPIRAYDQKFDDWLASEKIQKLVVYNRYKPSLPAVAYVRGFALKEGAIASTVAHDSHNIIAMGATDKDLVDVINRLIQEKGGLVAASNKKIGILPLPIAGLMSEKTAEEVASSYSKISKFVKTDLECPLTAPFMTLSFLALLVIPELKLSDKGLFDVKNFEFSGIFS